MDNPRSLAMEHNRDEVAGAEGASSSSEQQQAGGGAAAAAASSTAAAVRAPSADEKLPTDVRHRALIKRFLDHKYGYIFASPVDPAVLGIPDYFDVVKEPMDLGTVQARLGRGNAHYFNDHYTQADLRRDVLLCFDNAILYNDEGSPVHGVARELKEQFLVDIYGIMPSYEGALRRAAAAGRAIGGLEQYYSAEAEEGGAAAAQGSSPGMACLLQQRDILLANEPDTSREGDKWLDWKRAVEEVEVSIAAEEAVVVANPMSKRHLEGNASPNKAKKRH